MAPLWHRAFRNDSSDRFTERILDAIGGVALQSFDDVRLEMAVPRLAVEVIWSIEDPVVFFNRDADLEKALEDAI